MKILLFHPTLLPAPKYGGVERVVIWLARGLVERGHEVWVAAYPGSQLPPGVRFLEISPDDRSAEVLLTRLPAGVEMVHFMAPPEKRAKEQLACAQVLTVHGNGQAGEEFPRNTVFLSQDHAKRHGATCFVYNGIDPEEYEFSPKFKEDWFLFFSKTQWRVKNVSGAVSLCLEAGASLRIAGGDRPYGLRALCAIHPRLKWEGSVGGPKKNFLLSHAKALVFPVIWPEPFGLAVVEALVSGTPVFGSRVGSLPELVGPEVGALLSTRAEWIDMLRSPARFDPEKCRAWVKDKFHFRQMALGYEEVYKKVLAGETLNEVAPVASEWRI